MEVNKLLKESSLSQSEEFAFSDLADLSFIQIFILYITVAFSTQTIRFNLLNDINDYFFKEKPISPSTFYNSLKKLEKKGLVCFQDDEKSGVAKSVQATPLAKIALQKISNLTSFGVMDLGGMLKDLLPKVSNKLQLNPVHSSLILHFDDFLVFEFLEDFYKRLSKEIYILTDDKNYQRYLKRGITFLKQSKFEKANKMIREPNDFFDVTFLVRYRRTNNLYGVSEKYMLQEALRVTKSNGKIIIITLDSIPKTNHILLDHQGEVLKNNQFFFSISEQELRTDLLELGLQDLVITNINGLIIAWVTIP